MPAQSLPLAVLWDLDGVLVDTAEFHYQTWAQTLGEIGVPFDRPTFKHLFGRNNVSTITAVLGYSPPPELIASLGERKESLFRQQIRGQAQPLPGVRPWLERLQASGVPQAVASSAPQANIDALIDELGLRSYFTVLVAGDDLPAKPDPAVFHTAARRLGVSPQDNALLVVIEDSLAGVEAAHRAGMKCIAVATTHPASALKAADLVVEHLDRLSPDMFEMMIQKENIND
jgi:beta-phosphoglucomutase